MMGMLVLEVIQFFEETASKALRGRVLGFLGRGECVATAPDVTIFLL